MDNSSKKPISRVFTVTEARHLFERFEDVHCYRQNDEGEVTHKCPGWRWDLTHVNEQDEPQQGGCAYKNSFKLCECLRLAAEGHYVVEIRPKNQEDLDRERQYERDLLEVELRKLKQARNDTEEQILELENKLRNL